MLNNRAAQEPRGQTNFKRHQFLDESFCVVSFQITCSSPCLLTPSQSQGGLVRLDYFLSKASKLAAPILILFGDRTVGTDSVQERMVSEPLLFFA